MKGSTSLVFCAECRNINENKDVVDVDMSEQESTCRKSAIGYAVTGCAHA